MNSPRESDISSTMPKHILHWKAVKSQDVRGAGYYSRLPEAFDLIYRGTLLSSILAMEKKNAISFENAVNLAKKNWWKEARAGRGDQADWYYDHFIEWISSIGYHIELSGDEFEPYLMSEKII